MDPQMMAKQMIDLQKTTFDNTFNAMVMVQGQSEKMLGAFLGQANWLPEEGKKAFDEWMKIYKKGCEDFKKTVDEGFKKLEDYFTEAEKAQKGKSA